MNRILYHFIAVFLSFCEALFVGRQAGEYLYDGGFEFCSLQYEGSTNFQTGYWKFHNCAGIAVDKKGEANGDKITDSRKYATFYNAHKDEIRGSISQDMLASMGSTFTFNYAYRIVNPNAEDCTLSAMYGTQTINSIVLPSGPEQPTPSQWNVQTASFTSEQSQAELTFEVLCPQQTAFRAWRFDISDISVTEISSMRYELARRQTTAYIADGGFEDVHKNSLETLDVRGGGWIVRGSAIFTSNSGKKKPYRTPYGQKYVAFTNALKTHENEGTVRQKIEGLTDGNYTLSWSYRVISPGENFCQLNANYAEQHITDIQIPADTRPVAPKSDWIPTSVDFVPASSNGTLEFYMFCYVQRHVWEFDLDNISLTGPNAV